MAVPDITDFPNGFVEFWGKQLFLGSFSDQFQVNALAATYVRLVEAALIEYRLGKDRLNDFWNTHSSIQISAMNMSIGHFETCITDAHRAIRCFNRLRKSKLISEDLKLLLHSEKPKFCSDSVAGPIKMLRNTVHHLEEEVLDGTLPEGTSHTLRAEGNEVPVPDDPGQTVKTLEWLEIGSHKITFTELSDCLREMGNWAEKMAKFNPKR